jgi:hypothetical protein
VQLKTILQRVGLIASDAAAVPADGRDCAWEADLKSFLGAYDLL